MALTMTEADSAFTTKIAAAETSGIDLTEV